MGIIQRRILRYAALAGIAGAGAIAANAYLVGRNDLEFTWHTIGAPAPERSHQIRFAQLSDLHIGSIRPMHREILSRLKALRLDFLAITGDAVDDRDDLPALDRFLGLFDRDLPKFAVLGNWEHLGEITIAALSDLYTRHNGTLLVDATAELRIGERKLLITGLDDYVEGTPSTGTALRGIEPHQGHLILAHSPAHRDHLADTAGELDLSRFHIDALLAGHTHGGQVNILGRAPYLPPGSGRYKAGWYHDGSPAMYISRGIGTSQIPFRFGARPEVPVFTMWI